MAKKPVLVGLNGEFEGCTLELDNQTLAAGRDASACQLVYPAHWSNISRKHCTMKYTAKLRKLILRDYSSTGTYFEEDLRLKKGEKYELSSGQSFYLGDSRNSFRFIMQENTVDVTIMGVDFTPYKKYDIMAAVILYDGYVKETNDDYSLTKMLVQLAKTMENGNIPPFYNANVTRNTVIKYCDARDIMLRVKGSYLPLSLANLTTMGVYVDNQMLTCCLPEIVKIYKVAGIPWENVVYRCYTFTSLNVRLKKIVAGFMLKM